MKRIFSVFLLFFSVFFISTSCMRSVRTAEDITPGHAPTKLDWRYGAGDIKIQTSAITSQLMDRWYTCLGAPCRCDKPRLLISQIDNCTDQYISLEMIRNIIEEVAVEDGRFTIVVGNVCDESELDARMNKNIFSPKYANASQLQAGKATAPQYLAKVRLVKAVRKDCFYTFEDYRMTVTLYDIETQEVVDSASDVLIKKVRH